MKIRKHTDKLFTKLLKQRLDLLSIYMFHLQLSRVECCYQAQCTLPCCIQLQNFSAQSCSALVEQQNQMCQGQSYCKLQGKMQTLLIFISDLCLYAKIWPVATVMCSHLLFSNGGKPLASRGMDSCRTNILDHHCKSCHWTGVRDQEHCLTSQMPAPPLGRSRTDYRAQAAIIINTTACLCRARGKYQLY